MATQENSSARPVCNGSNETEPLAADPGHAEEMLGEEIDHVVRSVGYRSQRVVGLGGSAGSVAALQTFFAAMPVDSGMSFVVILHLAPEHLSVMAQILQRVTAMPVVEVRDDEEVEPNHVYVIPPGKQLSLAEGRLRLYQLEREPGRRVTIDLFFRALADTHGPHAIASVLSGADGDGAIGIKRIKERGGLTVVQDPSEAEYDAMPLAAIATGMVDWVLPTAQMAPRLLHFHQMGNRLQLPSENGPALNWTIEDEVGVNRDEEASFREVLDFLKIRTAHDFSYYKRATIVRRVGHRMQVNNVNDLSAYLSFLRTHPGEAGALLQDILISVTNFFRDRKCFDALREVMPTFFEGKGSKDAVRVWVAACATGEEAYSVAMLLFEYAGRLENPPVIQIFATDADEQAIRMARNGFYPESIVADVSDERLQRFFVKERHGYRIRREVREKVFFARHNLLRDSPFSRCDLVTCRNLLIYLNHEAQVRADQIFHFALRHGGLLFLGSSESIDQDSSLFLALDQKHRIYLRREVPAFTSPVPSLLHPPALSRTIGEHHERYHPPVDAFARTGEFAFQSPLTEPAKEERNLSLSQLHIRMLEHFAPPSVIINEEYDIVHLSRHAGRFLLFTAGEATLNLLRVVQPMLRVDLRAALFRARQTKAPVEASGVPLDLDGLRSVVDIQVAPAEELAAGFLLVIFKAREPTISDAPAKNEEQEPVVRHLENELEQIKTQLRDTVRQYEISTDDLKASNEELQAINEELRAATEELEIGKEELQSVNEELVTVNQELKDNIEELDQVNNDLQNLMAATDIATVFLNRDLSIMRYTPSALRLFHLIPTDLGRPLSDLRQRLNYPELGADAERVLETGLTVEREVWHATSGCFLARLLPYRMENEVAGVVVTLIDISQVKQAEEALGESEARFRSVADLVPDLLWSNDPSAGMVWVNHRWIEYTGQTLAQAQGAGWTKVLHSEDREPSLQAFKDIEPGSRLRREIRIRGQDDAYRWFLFRAEPQMGHAGQVVKWFGAATDIDDLKAAQVSLKKSEEERLRLIVENAGEYAIFSIDLERTVISWNSGAERLLGFTEADIVGQNADIIFTPEDCALGAPQTEIRTALDQGRAIGERWHQRKDGTRFWGSGMMMTMHDSPGQAVGFVKIFRDQTEARQIKEKLEQSREELVVALRETERARAEAEAAGASKDRFLAVLSHELRTPLMPIQMVAEMLARREDLPKDVLPAMDMIRRNVQLEAHFIDDLLDLTHIMRGKIELVCERMDLHEALRRAVEVSEPDIAGKSQRLAVSLEARDHMLSGDFARLQQAFWNLLKNASKFSPIGGEIHLRSRNESGQIVIEFSDTGIGIEPDEIGHIFDAFTQANAAVSREFGGLGLGLTIAKATVEAQGGTMRAQSEGRSKGATFIVAIPLQHDSPPAHS